MVLLDVLTLGWLNGFFRTVEHVKAFTSFKIFALLLQMFFKEISMFYKTILAFGLIAVGLEIIDDISPSIKSAILLSHDPLHFKTKHFAAPPTATRTTDTVLFVIFNRYRLLIFPFEWNQLFLQILLILS